MRRTFCLQPCGQCSTRTRAILCDVGPAEQSALAAMSHIFSYGPRETVFYEGHACLGLHVLCTGRVKLTRTTIHGQRQIIALLGASDIIEKQAFRDQAVHEASCVTLEPSQICLIERQAYMALLKRNADLAVRMIQYLGQEVHRQLGQLDRFTSLTARQRLARLLLDLGNHASSPQGGDLSAGPVLKREELAELAGVAVETAIRLLSAFREEGLVRVRGRVITLLRPDRLARIARA